MNMVVHLAAKALILMAWWVVVGTIVLLTFPNDNKNRGRK